MPDDNLRVLTVAGSLGANSVVRAVLEHVGHQLGGAGCNVDRLDLLMEPLPLFSPETSRAAPSFAPLLSRVERADALVLGTPDYHGSMSGALKNFLDHFWKEFAGKLFATVVASHEKGLTVTDQLRTVARQCYAWSLPYAVSISERDDMKDGRVASEAALGRLEMLARDVRVYGGLLARQRQADLAGAEPGFMARYRV